MTIEQLLRLQLAFDQSRGFTNLPHGDLASCDDPLPRLEYSLIGLTGEVGEIANIIKRARRNQAQGIFVDSAPLPDLREEVADVLSYLLKLAQQANIDLTRAYLVKMCRNAHRFRRGGNTPRAVAICGPPGVGKTTIVQELGSELPEGSAYLERFEENVLLDRIDDPSGGFDADGSQRWFLETMASFIDANERPILLDQDPTAIALVYSQMLFDRTLLSSKAFEAHLARLLELEVNRAETLAGRLVILLDAPPATLAQRCQEKVGPTLNSDLLSNLRERFMAIFSGLPNVVKVATDRPLESVVTDIRVIMKNVL
jgi:thymidylate kinase/NTP pyrophosphatase (non-canonical NTP hydrolase)